MANNFLDELKKIRTCAEQEVLENGKSNATEFCEMVSKAYKGSEFVLDNLKQVLSRGAYVADGDNPVASLRYIRLFSMEHFIRDCRLVTPANKEQESHIADFALYEHSFSNNVLEREGFLYRALDATVLFSASKLEKLISENGLILSQTREPESDGHTEITHSYRVMAPIYEVGHVVPKMMIKADTRR